MENYNYDQNILKQIYGIELGENRDNEEMQKELLEINNILQDYYFQQNKDNNNLNYDAGPNYLGQGNLFRNNINNNNDNNNNDNQFKLLNDAEEDFNNNEDFDSFNFGAAPNYLGQGNLFRNNINNNNDNNNNDNQFKLLNDVEEDENLKNLEVDRSSRSNAVEKEKEQFKDYFEVDIEQNEKLRKLFNNPVKIEGLLDDDGKDYILNLKSFLKNLNNKKEAYLKEYEKLKGNYENNKSVESRKKYKAFKSFFVDKLKYELDKLKKINENLSKLRIYYNVNFEDKISVYLKKLADEVIELEDVYNSNELRDYVNYYF